MKFHRIDLLAFPVALLIVFAYNKYSDHLKDLEPTSKWFEVRNLFVPDFIEGEDPVIVYDSIDLLPHTRVVNAKVYQADMGPDVKSAVNNKGPVCERNKDSEEHQDTVLMSEFLPPDCVLWAGRYVMKVHYVLVIPNYPPKQLDYTTNIFTVLPSGSQLYITPEQSEKLEAIQ